MGGGRYHALNPETFWSANATFQLMVDGVALHWDRHGLSEQESERLYAGGCEWYRRHGMTTSMVPPNRAAFELEVERYYRDVLQPILRRTA